MFTGLVEAVGRVREVGPASEAGGDAGHFIIDAVLADDPLRKGDSIAVDGICLTVTECQADTFRVSAVEATLSRTTAAEWQAGRQVNLERSLRAGQRLGGHFVQGHIDGLGTVQQVEQAGAQVVIDVALPEIVAEVTVLHGSITIDGISLTVSELPGGDVARVAIIPFTWSHTNLARLVPGSRVNLEGDLIGRFVIEHLRRSRHAIRSG